MACWFWRASTLTVTGVLWAAAWQSIPDSRRKPDQRRTSATRWTERERLESEERRPGEAESTAFMMQVSGASAKTSWPTEVDRISIRAEKNREFFARAPWQ